jgi:SAM-dependent methyltransferase
VPQSLSPEDVAPFYRLGYYEGEIYEDYVGTGEARREEFRKRLDKLKPVIPQRGRVLDCGAAFGFFVEVALAEGYEAEGVELSAEAATQARARSVPVRQGTVEAAGFPANHFDLVTMWDTIEHLTSPRTTVAEIHRILKPGGVVALTTGNLRSVTAWVYRDRWSLIVPPWHLFYFDPGTVERLMRSLGFVDVVVDTDTPLLFDIHWNDHRRVQRRVTRIFRGRRARRVARWTKLGYLMAVTARKPAITE